MSTKTRRISEPISREHRFPRTSGRAQARDPILIAGLESDTQELVTRALAVSGLEVFVAVDVFDALFEEEQEHEFMCLILGENFENISFLRSLGVQFPILTLVTTSGASARVMALEVGSDDCLGPKFAIAELVARVHSLSRRRLPMVEQSELTAGELSLSVEGYTASTNGSTVILTPIETEILRLLMESRGRIVSASRIGCAVWGAGAEVGPNLVSVHVSNLRRKLGVVLGWRRIRTLRGRGYMLIDGAGGKR